jgi:acyl-CoA thioester hydrolase
MEICATKIRVRYAETDQMGVVYYANYLVWFEVGRVEYLRQLGFEYAAMEKDDGCLLPVVEVNCRYKAPARYDEELVLETRVENYRMSVIKFGYRLLRPPAGPNGPQLLAEGDTVHVIVNRHMQRVPLPEKVELALKVASVEVTS